MSSEKDLSMVMSIQQVTVKGNKEKADVPVDKPNVMDSVKNLLCGAVCDIRGKWLV